MRNLYKRETKEYTPHKLFSKVALCAILLFFTTFASFGQNVIYSCGFEDDTENANWTLANGDQSNQWYIGTAANNGGEKSLYISSDGGVSNNYNTSSTSYVYAYRELNIEENGLYYISFDWYAQGESSFDLMKAYLVPTSLNPDFSAGESNGMSQNNNNAPSDWIAAGNMSSYNGYSNWQHCAVEKELEADSYYLVFFWKNDGYDGSNPPAAIDNINIMKITCRMIANLSVTDITTESATINWTESGSAESWEVIVSEIGLSDEELAAAVPVTTTSPSYSATGLEHAHTYYVYVRAVCSEDSKSIWTTTTFATRVCIPEDMCEIHYELFDRYGDGWSGNAIKVFDATTNEVLATWTINSGSSATGSLAICNGREIRFEWVNGSFAYETSYNVFDVDDDEIFSGSGEIPSPVSYTMYCPTCHKIKNLSVIDVTSESATVSWSGTTDSWQLVLSETILDEDALENSTPISSTDSSYLFTGLSIGTRYYVYVRAVCSDTDHSLWKSKSFLTPNYPATLPYSNGFEDDEENAKWTLTDCSSNKWHIGYAVNNGGENSLYISNNDGVSNAYNNSLTSYAYACREIEITATGDYQFDFDWRAKGESSYDYLRAFVIPFLLNPNLTNCESNGISSSNTPSGWIDASQNGLMNGQSSWKHSTKILNLEAGIYYLAFFWVNDNDQGDNPPASIDNISIERIINPVVSTVSHSNVSSASANLQGSIVLHGASDITVRGFEYGTSAENLTENTQSADDTDDFSATITGLTPNTIYYYRAYATNSDGSGYGEIKSFKTYGSYAGHDYVDLGLPSGTKWASMNVGAENPEDSGDYFAWGETTAKDNYNWNTYGYCNGNEDIPKLTKYCNDEVYGNNGFTDDLTTLEATDDAATANWGSDWRMPTRDEIQELINNCNRTWTTQNGINGMLFTSRNNGNFIFLPAAGFRNDNTLEGDGSVGSYWSSSIVSDSPLLAWYLYYNSDDYLIYNYYRNEGSSVRAIYRQSPTVATNSSDNITLTTATLYGSILNIGTSDVIERGFIYGTNRGNLTETEHSETATNDFSASLTGLANGTTYYYRAYATNSDTTGYGEIKSFTTPSGELGDHYYVDLGLPSGTRWATTNIGATNPEDFGSEFAWGETTTKDDYDWSTYIYSNGGDGYNTLTKYCNNSEYGDNGFTDSLTSLEAADDAATVNWGEEWIMPSAEDMQELVDNCSTTWITINGIKGLMVTSNSNGNSIFLPSGYDEGLSTTSKYWSNSLYTDNPSEASYLSVYSGDSESDPNFSMGYESRFMPMRIRPVYKVEPTAMDIDYEPYNCDFEDAEENANWVLNNGRQTNKWHIGYAVNNGGEKSLYLSDDGGENYSYNNRATSYIYAYRRINITAADKYQFDFDRRVRGEGNYDLLRAFLVPDSLSHNLTAGTDNGMNSTNNTPPAGWIDISTAGVMSEQMGWKHNSSKLQIDEPGLYYLTFFWKNDGSGGNNPPAAVDNVMVRKLPPFEITTLSAPHTSTTATLGAEIVIDREVEITQVGFVFGENENQLLDTLSMAYGENTFTRQIADLTPQTNYCYRAFAKYDDKTVFGDIVSFRTKSNDTDGTTDNPLTIENAEEWSMFAEAMLQSENQSTSTYKGFEIYNCGDDTYFELTADIDLADCNNIVVNKFGGHFNGAGHTVTIHYNQQLGAANVFNDLENGFVDSLNVLVPASFDVRYDVAIYGALCINAKSSVISNCTTQVANENVKVMAQSSGKFGGIAGNSVNSTITNCTNNLSMELSADSYLWGGGIVGNIEGGSVSGCTNNAVITGVYAGGIVGQLYEATLSSNLNAGNIIGQEMVGGIVASVLDGNVVVDKCMNIAELYATNKGCGFVSLGGIVGYNPLANLTISNCANYGSFTDISMQLGGIFGNGIATMSNNVSVPQFFATNGEDNLYNCVYPTVGTTEDDYSDPNLTETDDFFDEQVGDLRVDSLRLKYNSRGTGKPTAEMLGSELESTLSANWNYTAGLYPMPAGIPENNRTIAARIPIYFAQDETSASVMSNFTLPTTILGHNVSWASSNPNYISISRGNATVTRPTLGQPDVEVRLTATYEGETKTFIVLVISPKLVPVNTDFAFIESDSLDIEGHFDSNTSGLSYLKEYGFIYSKKPNISDSTKVVCTNLSEEIHDETFNGRFFYYVTETESFVPGKRYYFTAFATTADTTLYGEVNYFRTVGPPDALILYTQYRDTTSMGIYVHVLSDDENGLEVNMFCGTDRNNLTEQAEIEYNSNLGYYYAHFYDLQPETQYWFVAEATDSLGTSRSDTVSFYTYGTFIDERDDTEYKSIIIGNQKWMAENLRYGGNIPFGTQGELSSTLPRRYNPGNSSNSVPEYGYLYNWPAAMNTATDSSSVLNPSGVQGICPNGWHLPSKAEWNQLYKTLGGDWNYAASQLASYNTDPEYGAIITGTYNFARTGFEEVEAGRYMGQYEAGQDAYFWSATEKGSNKAYNRHINIRSTMFFEESSEMSYGLSVRCIKGKTIYAALDTVIICADEYTYLDTTFTESGDYMRRFYFAEDADTAYCLHLNIDDCYRMASGVVTDASTSTAIPNARVVIGNAVAWTNDDGEYSLMAPKGTQPLWVSAVDYATYSEEVDIHQDTSFNFELYSAQISINAEDISITTYPYMAHYDSITISNVGTAPLVWSSVAEYEGLELLPEPEGTRHSRNSRALWDSIQTFNTRFNAEQAIATDGFFIYTSSWQRPGEFNRYTPDGEYVETFFIENVGMIRNLSYDGTYFYGTDATNVILKLDLYNQIVVDSIITDLNNIRHCSFNKQNGKLLAGDWNSLYSIDTATGVSTRIRNDLENIYGSAFDNLSPGGPYLWLFSQTSQDNGPSAYIRQFSLSDGNFTDKAHYLDDIEISDVSLAGGICASAQIFDGKYVLLANVQNPTGHNTIAAYEIGRINNLVTTDRKNGEIQPNESVTIIISEYVTETGTFNATVRYHLANVIGDQSDDLNISISAVVPECDAVQQLTATTDNYTVVNLNWQPVELGDYNSVSYLVFCDNSQYAIDTTTETSITLENLPAGEHCFNVRASLVGDYTCMTHPSETVCVEILEIPCNIPLVLEVMSEGEAITISWNMPVGVDYFSLYKYSEPLDEHLTTTTFVDTDVVPESEYCYVLIAHFEDGVCSEVSTSKCFRIVSDFCTETPVLIAEAFGNTVALKWTECEGAVKYRIFRDNEFVGTTNEISYTDNVTESGNHCYVIESDCEYGMFKLSNEECVFTDAIDEWSADELSIYPNPTDDQFFIEGQRIATVQIFNAIGQLVTEIENNESERITINCNGWSPGLYSVQIISTEGKVTTQKISIFR